MANERASERVGEFRLRQATADIAEASAEACRGAKPLGVIKESTCAIRIILRTTGRSTRRSDW